MSRKGDLLDIAIRAHGGYEAWQSVRRITFHATTGGIALPLRGRPGAFRSCDIDVYTGTSRTVIRHYPEKNYRGIFEAGSVSILNPEGAVIAERRNPRAAFSGLRHRFYWDALDALYFGGYAHWNYLNLPFLLSGSDFVCDEIEPWREKGERFRRLRVLFPYSIPTHSREQVFYFDTDGLLVRHDYTAEVFGSWARAAHYSWAHQKVGGIVFPTRRQVFPRLPSGHPFRLITLVSIGLDAIEITR